MLGISTGCSGALFVEIIASAGDCIYLLKNLIISELNVNSLEQRIGTFILQEDDT